MAKWASYKFTTSDIRTVADRLAFMRENRSPVDIMRDVVTDAERMDDVAVDKHIEELRQWAYKEIRSNQKRLMQ